MIRVSAGTSEGLPSSPLDTGLSTQLSQNISRPYYPDRLDLSHWTGHSRPFVCPPFIFQYTSYRLPRLVAEPTATPGTNGIVNLQKRVLCQTSETLSCICKHRVDRMSTVDEASCSNYPYRRRCLQPRHVQILRPESNSADAPLLFSSF